MSSRKLDFDAPTAIADGDPLAGSGLARDAGGTGAGNLGVRAFDRLQAALGAEQAQWFHWVPMALGAGIAAYFVLPFEPSLPTVPLALVGVFLDTLLAGVYVAGIALSG
jgi:hypothetical protein